ncbi:MAG TPA: iron-containing alcohol dehydrogenase, partial [Chloroflexi bacterium]|nr:iron-containing alcohol dehydrogenase [Chloroflexota bacterium]
DLGVPQRLRDLDIPEEALDDIAPLCIETQSRVMTNNPRKMTVEDARQVLHEAY